MESAFADPAQDARGAGLFMLSYFIETPMMCRRFRLFIYRFIDTFPEWKKNAEEDKRLVGDKSVQKRFVDMMRQPLVMPVSDQAPDES